MLSDTQSRCRSRANQIAAANDGRTKNRPLWAIANCVRRRSFRQAIARANPQIGRGGKWNLLWWNTPTGKISPRDTGDTGDEIAMQLPDVLRALIPVARALRRSASYYVCGSTASAYYGVSRMTADVDLVAELLPSLSPRCRIGSGPTTTSTNV